MEMTKYLCQKIIPMKKLYSLLVLAVCALGLKAQTPTFQTVVNNTGGTATNQMYDATTDVSSNIYFCGNRTDAITLSGTTLAAGNGGVYFGKANAIGTISWLKGGGTSMASGDIAYDVALDQNNNLYVCGAITALSNASFDGVTAANPGGGFVLKVDNNGNVLWVESYGPTVYAIAVDRNNNPVINLGNSELAQLSASNGSVQNSVVFSADNQNIPRHNIAIDANNNIVIQGGNKIIKFDDALTQLWSTPVTYSLAETFKLNLDQAGNVYSSFYGLFGSITIGNVTKTNFPNGYIYKLDAATGNPIFVDSVLIGGFASKIREVIPDNSGNYYIVGDGAFNTPVVLKTTSSYSALWQRNLDNAAEISETELIGDNCLVMAGLHTGTLTLDSYTINLPAGSFGIDNSMFAYLCDGNVSIAPEDGMLPVSTYPNPVENILRVDLNAIQSATAYDVLGKRIALNSVGANELDLSNLSPGLYSVQILSGDNKLYSTKVIKK